VVSAERTAAGSAVLRNAAQHRILDAALALIAENGVGGTSLQMIADEVGVTKAAVYHQFKTKEEIVIALTERELGRLDDALEAAEAESSRPRAREVLLSRVIDMAVERRRAAATCSSTPSSSGSSPTTSRSSDFSPGSTACCSATRTTRRGYPPRCCRERSAPPSCTPSSRMSTTTRCARSCCT
jgi:AcrR family transcriptional regulator